MKEWEKKRREELQLEVKDGLYEIGTPGSLVAWTGKDGYINYIIELEKLAKIYINTNQNETT